MYSSHLHNGAPDNRALLFIDCYMYNLMKHVLYMFMYCPPLNGELWLIGTFCPVSDLSQLSSEYCTSVGKYTHLHNI